MTIRGHSALYAAFPKAPGPSPAPSSTGNDGPSPPTSADPSAFPSRLRPFPRPRHRLAEEIVPASSSFPRRGAATDRAPVPLPRAAGWSPIAWTSSTTSSHWPSWRGRAWSSSRLRPPRRGQHRPGGYRSLPRPALKAVVGLPLSDAPEQSCPASPSRWPSWTRKRYIATTAPGCAATRPLRRASWRVDWLSSGMSVDV
jgi:hypothetical protein